MPQITLRPYQRRAVNDVMRHWRDQTAERVCLVAPTGSGKTVMGEEVAFRAYQAGAPILWVAHRRELVKQAASHLSRRFAPEDVGLIMPGEPYNPDAKVQVGTVQTLLASGKRPDARLVVFDECAHYVADDWSSLHEAYPNTRLLGLTATPQRTDGRPLGDMFERLVVAAQYSDLIRDGHLVPCAVYQPPERVDNNELALDPVKAYQAHAEGSRAFCFAPTVELATQYAAAFNEVGIPATMVEASTPTAERDSAVERFRAGDIRVLCNVYIFTEGTDIPAAQTIILARGCSHASPYLQMVGRVLRPAPDKTEAVLIDLTGASLKHGLPTEDRVYSLEGNAITTVRETPLKVCLRCGYTMSAADMKCPRCGFTFPVKRKPQPKIHDMMLRRVYAGADTPPDARYREYLRLRGIQKDRGYDLYWVAREYKKLFHQDPTFDDVSREERTAYFCRLAALARSKGWKRGYALIRYRELLGQWPTQQQKQVAGL